MNGLDPRDPLVLDTRALNLARRPGSMVTVSRSIPSPENMGIAMARVLPGSPIDVHLRLESVMEGVLVSGIADIHVDAQCARCLENFDWDEEVEFSEMFTYPPTDARGAIIPVVDEDLEEPLPALEDDMINLEEVLRDAVVLGFPLAPVCKVDCSGLCSACGVRLDDDPGHKHDVIDPRWEALTTLVGPEDS